MSGEGDGRRTVQAKAMMTDAAPAVLAQLISHLSAAQNDSATQLAILQCVASSSDDFCCAKWMDEFGFWTQSGAQLGEAARSDAAARARHLSRRCCLRRNRTHRMNLTEEERRGTN